MNKKQLWDSILQQAISGKLVPQLDSEPAVEQIGTAPAPDEVPFTLPEKWKWVQFDKVLDLISGRDLAITQILDKPTQSSVPYITGASQMIEGCLVLNRWTEVPVVISHKNDVLLSCKGTVGKLALNTCGDIHIARQIMAIRCKAQVSQCEHVFVKLFFEFVTNKLQSQVRGLIPGISRKDVLSLWFPLPPLEEQRRIVAKLDELKPLVEQFGEAYDKLSELEVDFPRKLKSSILQAAMQGKLVPQLDSELAVEQIGPALDPDDVPFELPEKWTLVQLSSITTLINGRAYKKAELLEEAPGLTPIIRVGNFFTQSKIYYSDLNLAPKHYCDKGDLLFAWSASFGPKIWEGPRSIFHYHIWKIEYNRQYLDCKWLYYWLEERSEALKSSGHGIAMLHITKQEMEKKPIAVPPLEEQRRIVERIEQLFAEVDKMSACKAP